MGKLAEHHFEIAKMRANRAQLMATIERQKSQYLDQVKSKEALLENMRASLASIKKLDADIEAMVAAHGEATFSLEDLLALDGE